MVYRGLNRKMVRDAYPLASIENNLHKLQGAKYFTTLDSAGAYHNIEIHPESREYAAFITPFGQYHFVCMPFGLSNAGAFYSRMMEMKHDGTTNVGNDKHQNDKRRKI